MMQVVDQLPRTDLGEGPWWDAKEQNLFIVDLLVGTIHRLNPQTGKHDTIETGMTVGFAVLDQNDDVIAGLKDGIYRLQFGATQKELLAQSANAASRVTFQRRQMRPSGPDLDRNENSN